MAVQSIVAEIHGAPPHTDASPAEPLIIFASPPASGNTTSAAKPVVALTPPSARTHTSIAAHGGSRPHVSKDSAAEQAFGAQLRELKQRDLEQKA